MRSYKHWTAQYVPARLLEICYRKTSPELPWLTRAANQMLASLLWPSDVGLEFGSGRSTIWFSKRVRLLTSVEHDSVWYSKVRQSLENGGISNVDYRLVPKDQDEARGDESGYVQVMAQFAPESVDFALVDGAYRDWCALRAMDLIRPGGFLIIDNVNWFLPSQSSSPKSRTERDGPNGETWCKVHSRLATWRRIWTSSGVTDTAIFFKPHS